MADIPVLSKIMDGLQAWQDNVVKNRLVGPLVQASARQALQQATHPDSVFRYPWDAPDRPASPYTQDQRNQLGRVVQAKTGQAAEEQYFKGDPWSEVVATTALDPLNLVGFGLPGRAASLLPAGSKIARGLEAANVVDQLPGKVTGAVIDKGTGLARGGLKLAGDAIGPMIPSNPALEAIGKGFGKTMSGWREQALASPGFHVNNWAGNIEAALRSGQGDVFRAAVAAPFTGRSSEVGDVLGAIGNHRTPLTYAGAGPPPAIDPASFGSRWSEQVQKLGREPNVNNPLTSPSVFRDIPDTYKPVNAVRDKVAGISEANRRFGSNRIEGPAIDAAFERTFQPEFQRNATEMESYLRGLKGPSGRPYPQAQKAANEFARSNGLMSPDDLREILNPGARARRAKFAANPMPSAGPRTPKTPDWRDAAVKEWEDRIITSMDAGTKNSTDIFFDYTANNPVDKLGQSALAFHRFAVNNIPKTIKAAGKNPVYANIPADYYRESDQNNKDLGLPAATWHGKMPLGPQLPNGEQAYFDPLGISPFGALVKSATRPYSQNDDEGTAFGQTADDLKGLGLGLNPFIDALLTVTGQHGRSFAPSFLRASQPANGILSAVADRPVDIEGLPKELLGNAQEQLTGQRPFPYQEYLLRKRQAELKALGGDPKQAGSQVGDQMAIEGLGGFAGIPGLKLLTPEEQTIRKNTALAQAYRLAGNQTAARANPTVGAYANLDPRAEQIANWAKLSSADRQRLLRDPEVRDQLLDKLAMQLHNTGSTGANISANPLVGQAQARQLGLTRTSARPTARPLTAALGARG